ncbi:MAG: hypothetical protein AAGI03_02040 [Pseudomonadota bacterium]
MAFNALRPSETLAIAGVVNPDLNTTGNHRSDWINAGDYQALMAIVMTGTLGSGATVDAKLEQAQSASGTGAKDVEGGAITQLTKGGVGDNVEAVIELFTDRLDLENGYTHVRLSMTVGGASSDSGGIVLGCGARYAPASRNNLATVTEIVNV